MVNYDYLYNKEHFGDALHTDRFSSKQLRFRIINNATILPCVIQSQRHPIGGLFDSRGNLVSNTFVHNGGGYYATAEPMPYISETVIYLGMLSVTWGHCIMESLSHVWFFNSEFYKQHFKDYRIVYTVAGGILPENFIKLLKILDIDLEKLQAITVPTKFRSIIVPDASLQGGGCALFK